MNALDIKTPNDLLSYINIHRLNDGLSIRGTSKLIGISNSTLSRALKPLKRGDALRYSQLAEKLIEQGIEPSSLVMHGINSVALIVILDYYAYESKSKAQGARILMKTFSVVGLREVFNQLDKVNEIIIDPIVSPSEPKSDIEALLTTISSIESIRDDRLRELAIQAITGETATKPAIRPTPLYSIAELASELGYELTVQQKLNIGFKMYNKFAHLIQERSIRGDFNVCLYRREDILPAVIKELRNKKYKKTR